MTTRARMIAILTLSMALPLASAPYQAHANKGHSKMMQTGADADHADDPAAAGHDDDADDDHADGDDDHDGGGAMDAAEEHRSHEHGLSVEAMRTMSAAEQAQMIALMQSEGLGIPEMDAARGRDLFVQTGCVVCHSVNGVGGDIGPNLDAANLPSPMNAFEFAARMWRGAAAMTALQEDILGNVIPLTGQDLADIIAFAHNADEQKKLQASAIPQEYLDLMTQ